MWCQGRGVLRKRRKRRKKRRGKKKQQREKEEKEVESKCTGRCRKDEAIAQADAIGRRHITLANIK